MKASTIKSHMNGRLAKKRGGAQIAQDAVVSLDNLADIGLGFHAMDSSVIGAAVTNGFLPAEAVQSWLPGTVRAMTTPIDIDFIAGITTVGKWEDEEILVRTEEDFGKAEIYGDNTNIPLAEVNPGIERRHVVRFEQGFQVGKLEGMRLDAAGFNAADSKRRAANKSLDVSRNAIGWNGLAGTTTYGLLNDPNLSAAVAAGTAWSAATFAQLVTEFTAMRGALETQMGTALRDDAAFLLVLPTGYRGYLNVYNTGGNLSFGQWLRENYPNTRIEYAANLKAASSGKDLAYLIVENVGDLDDSDIGSATLIQAVPARYQVLGSDNGIKGYIEDAVNATAGVIVLRPWAVVRRETSV